MFNRKARRITELKNLLDYRTELLSRLVEGSEAALEALKDQQQEIVELKDELNAQTFVLQGAYAKVTNLADANVRAQEYAHQAQQIIMDQAERVAELQYELEDALALVDDLQTRDNNPEVFDQGTDGL